MTSAQLERAASLGAWIEFCYLGRFWGEDSAMPAYPRQNLQEATEILRVAPERTFITTDLGQVGMPAPWLVCARPAMNCSRRDSARLL